MRELLLPFVEPAETAFAALPVPYGKLVVYLDLLLRWNARTNLSAIRDQEAIVTRHFGEGLFAAVCLRHHLPEGASLLDLGSGAGFPGLPIQLALPEVAVTLAESQGKKAAFLREAVRVLELKTAVWAGRAEDLPTDARFDVVTLRAVDRMESAVELAASRLRSSGLVAELAVQSAPPPARLVPFAPAAQIPGSHQRVLRLWTETMVPRGTPREP